MAEVAAMAALRDGPARAERLSAVARIALVVATLGAAAFASQVFMGAYSGSVGAYPDEAAHYMSGLLIHDYVLAGFPERPMAYAQKYYYHHPSLGIGYWPPAFYVAEALWMLSFGISRTSVLAFCAVVCACLQFLLFWNVARRGEMIPAVVVAAAFPFLPAVRYSNSMVMTDVFVALACFGATLQLARFLDSPTWRRSIILGLWCSLALLSKFSAAYLALVPLVAILVSRRFDVLRRRAILVPAAVVLLATVPWLLYTRGLAALGLLPSGPEDYNPLSLAINYMGSLYGATGPAVLTALAGFVAVVSGPLRRDTFWASMAATPVALGLFVWFAPVDLESRHVILAIPAMLILSVQGVRAIGERAAPPRHRTIVSTLLLVGALSMAVLAGPRSNNLEGGFGQAAEYLMTASKEDSVILVSSTVGWREPAMVVELAQREAQRPGRRTVRSRKLLAETDWNATYERLRYRTSGEVLDALRRDRVQFVALHSSDDPYFRKAPHALLLANALRSAPHEWRQVRRFNGAPRERTLIFSRTGTPTGWPASKASTP